MLPGEIFATEIISIEGWPDLEKRALSLSQFGAVVAVINFTLQNDVLLVSEIDFKEPDVHADIGIQLLPLLQSHYPSYWIALPKTVAVNSLGMPLARKPNESRLSAELKLKEFDDSMIEAEKVFDHMQKHCWSHSGRMQFYTKFPEFYQQETIRESLQAKIDLLPAELIKVPLAPGKLASHQ
jgi:hypothetical protein